MLCTYHRGQERGGGCDKLFLYLRKATRVLCTYVRERTHGCYFSISGEGAWGCYVHVSGKKPTGAMAMSQEDEGGRKDKEIKFCQERSRALSLFQEKEGDGSR